MSDYELKRINALTEASAINDSDVFAIDSAAGTKKVAWEMLKGEVDADISEAVSNKADKDGTYPDMAVGSVLGTNTVTDREPYFLRPSASIGDREFDTLVGGSLGWNQLLQNGNFAESTGWAARNGTVSIADNIATVTATQTGTLTGLMAGTNIATVQGHKYFFACDVKSPITGDASFSFSGYHAKDSAVTANTWVSAGTIYERELEGGNSPAYCLIKQSINTGATIQYKNFIVIDLTTTFGSTIADYIYTLETAHAGDGVAWVRKYLPNTYYAYCAPTLKHVSGVSAHVMRDANNNVIGNYPIDSTWVGMGVPKLDSDGKLYFDGDTYASDGTVTERFGIVDLGTLTAQFGYNSSSKRWEAPISGMLTTSGRSADVIASNYIADTSATAGDSGKMFIYNGGAYIYDPIGSTAPTGMLVYPLATPTTSTASPFINPQICDPNGTEEYVTTGLVPVGHETEYVENLADKLTDIPDLPTTAGTYRLKVTVSGGVPSYSWVSA